MRSGSSGSELKLELPLLVAGVNGSELARQLGNVSGALPYTVLISPRGTLVQARLGLIKPELLRAWLDVSCPRRRAGHLPRLRSNLPTSSNLASSFFFFVQNSLTRRRDRCPVASSL